MAFTTLTETRKRAETFRKNLEFCVTCLHLLAAQKRVNVLNSTMEQL